MSPHAHHFVYSLPPEGAQASFGAALRSVVRAAVQRSSAMAALRLVRFADQRLRAARQEA